MCGIIGYIGNREAAPIVYDSLRKLEYRGYDSYGFATVQNRRIWLHKDVGKISEAGLKKLPGSIAVGHSRWATHGGVMKKNAHPHTDCRKEIAVVHNGIVENYQELKEELIKTGHVFSSDTDTEIIPHLIEEYIGLGFEEAVIKAIDKIKGRYAVVVLSAKHPDKLIAARRGSPLIVGVKNGEYFIASDIPAFLEHTKDVMYLDDNEVVVIEKNRTRFYSLLENKEVKKKGCDYRLGCKTG